MRASCQGRLPLSGGAAGLSAGLSASTPLASPSDAPIAIPTHSIETLRDLVIIKPQHTCGGDPPLPSAAIFPAAVVHAELCGARTDRNRSNQRVHGFAFNQSLGFTVLRPSRISKYS